MTGSMAARRRISVSLRGNEFSADMARSRALTTFKTLKTGSMGGFEGFEGSGHLIAVIQPPWIDRIGSRWTPASFRCCRCREKVQLHQQLEAGLHLVTIGETRPIMLMHLADRKTVLQVPCAYFGQNGLRSRSFGLIGCSVQTTSVAFEIFAKCKRLAHCAL
jgi:hypothetical protein